MRKRVTTLNRSHLIVLTSLFIFFATPRQGWAQAALEIPRPFSFQSGLRVIMGWVCEAQRVEIEIDGAAVFPAAYGAAREDTRGVCGDAANGFSLPFNWNLLGDGRHEVRAIADGEEVSRATVRVVTLGSDFRSGLAAECMAKDFPRVGQDTRLRWEESLQNFALIGPGQSRSGEQEGSAGGARGVLENPRAGSLQSGIGPVSGWVCEGERVELIIDEGVRVAAVAGIAREDTRGVCGDANNGFGVAVNWNLVGAGEHLVRAVVDGEEFARATVTVATLGEEFVRGGSGRCRVGDFPQAGTDLIVRWQQSTQNFVITDLIATDAPPVAVAGEPTREEVGLRLAPEGMNLRGLTPAGVDQVARGSYLVNGATDCIHCHVTSAGYMAGGEDWPTSPFVDLNGFNTILSRNLTPDPETGLQLTEAQFIEVMRTGKDFHDSTKTDMQRLVFVMPSHIYRFMALTDLKAIYTFLHRIPPVKNEVRETFQIPPPFPPFPFPAELGDGDPINDPNNVERGFRLLDFFASGPEAEAFSAHVQTAVDELPPVEQAAIGRGSYLVNAVGGCGFCHTSAAGNGVVDAGLIPGTQDVNTPTYLAGGADVGTAQSRVLPDTFNTGPLFASNLTPDPDTGLLLTEKEFIQVMRFGADFRRPGSSLRVVVHFPTLYRYTLDDLQAIYAYLRNIPAVHNSVEIVP